MVHLSDDNSNSLIHLPLIGTNNAVLYERYSEDMDDFCHRQRNGIHFSNYRKMLGLQGDYAGELHNDRFNVDAIGVKNESAVVVVAIGHDTRHAVVCAPYIECGFLASYDLLSRLGTESDMRSSTPIIDLLGSLQ